MIQKRRAVDPKQPVLLKILPEGIDVSASHTQTILEAIDEAGIEINHSCGGMGTCGTCRVFVERGLEKFGPRNGPENEIAEDRNFAENERLACQNFVKDGLVLRKP